MQAARVFQVVILLLPFLFSSAVVAQVFDPGPSDSELFDEVINLPDESNIGDHQSVGGVDGRTVQLNITRGGSVGFSFDANAGAEVNISGGSIGSVFSIRAGSEVNISGGSVGGSVVAFAGSLVNISGGDVGAFFDSIGGEVNISGGNIGTLFLAEAGSVVNVSGGNFGESFRALRGSFVDISGGNFEENLRASNNSHVNLSGTEFILDGVPLDNLVPGKAFTILDREVSLTGRFEDGSAFSFFLGTVSTSDDFVSSSATLSVTLTMPFVLGDVNCDGVVNLLDVNPFVALVISGGFSAKADINSDGSVDLLDAAPFVQLIVQ